MVEGLVGCRRAECQAGRVRGWSGTGLVVCGRVSVRLSGVGWLGAGGLTVGLVGFGLVGCGRAERQAGQVWASRWALVGSCHAPGGKSVPQDEVDEIEVYGSEAQSGTQLATYSFEVRWGSEWLPGPGQPAA